MKNSSRASTVPYEIIPRNVSFDWQTAPLHWLRDDPFASHVVNEFSYLLNQGEKFFCNAFREALPHVTDAKLRRDVKGFIKQEAIHSRAHFDSIEAYLKRLGLDAGPFEKDNALLFDRALAKDPFGIKVPKFLAKRWLIIRVGVVAAVEHFTAAMGMYVLEADWERSGADPVVADLFRWHGAEEVEHRTVAYDLYRHLGGGWMMRIFILMMVVPVLLGRMAAGTATLIRQDASLDRRLGQTWRFRFWKAWSAVEARGNAPGPKWLLKQSLRFLPRGYEPIHEASTEQALAYLNSSPGVLAKVK